MYFAFQFIESVLSMDQLTAMKRLMKYPPVESVSVLIEEALSFADPTKFKFTSLFLFIILEFQNLKLNEFLKFKSQSQKRMLFKSLRKNPIRHSYSLISH